MQKRKDTKEKRVPLMVRVPPELRQRLRHRAVDEEREIQAIVEEALVRYLAEKRGKKP